MEEFKNSNKGDIPIDIEDLSTLFSTKPRIDHIIFNKNNATTSENSSEEDESGEENNDINNNKKEIFLPGKAGIWVKTFGCAHNQSDSEYMMGQLQKNGYMYLNEIIKISINKLY